MSGPLNAPKQKAADLLYRAQILQRSQYEQVVSLVQRSNERAEEVILEQEILSEADLLKALSGIYRTHFVSTQKLSSADIPRATVQMIPKRVAETLGVFPVLFDRQTSVLSVVTPDPDNAELLREVKLVSGTRNVKAFVARPAAISAAIRKHHGGDMRAFEPFERGAIGSFGQVVTQDGRVMAAKDTQRRNAGLDFDPPCDPSPSGRELQAAAPVRITPQHAQPPPVPRRASATEQDVEVARAARDAMGSAPDLDYHPRTPKRPVAQATLSAPPPPASGNDTFELDPPSPPPPAAAHGRAPVRHTPELPKPGRRPTEAPESSAAPKQGNESEPPPQGVRTPSAMMSSVLQLDTAKQAFANDTTIELLTVMVNLLENSRQELRGHSSQVARLLKRVAERMSLDRNDQYSAVVAGHIHDIGKMGQFHLTALNCSEYEGHRVAAQKAYDTPLRLLEAVRLPSSIKNTVFHMYERFDGKGFPDKLAGKEIPLGARLLAVADTYADLTQNPRNPFRKVLGSAEAMNVVMQHKGTIFDPSVLDLFKALVLGEDMKAKLLANRHRALVVDPDPEESTVLELRMVEQGFDVRTARTVEAARKLLAAGDSEFDLVVCEVDLPDTDGLAFLSEARKESWGRELAWVVHTRRQGRTEAQRAFDLGAMDFVAKPVQADVLVAKLKAMLDQRSNHKAPKGVSGSLKEMGLPDIVQVLFHGRKTGRLNIKGRGKSGEIHFLEGNVANAIIGELSGSNAFYAMLKLDDGEFALDPSFKPPKRLIEEPAEALLIEGMRRMDEGL